ncbi:hypothetical protein LguiA_025674 [Lonicera macranthoides]
MDLNGMKEIRVTFSIWKEREGKNGQINVKGLWRWGGGDGGGTATSTEANPKSPNNENIDLANNNLLRIFTYEELRRATRQFQARQVLGRGRFGMVYKGKMEMKDNCGYHTMQVAIRELNPERIFQNKQYWMTEAEVIYLGNLRHPNLVKLIGYCLDGQHGYLVYEYMESGSLDKLLFREDGETLNWTRRKKIALDVAKGFAFLHALETPILYRYFKTSNILLDKDLNAKLSDIGIQKNDALCVTMGNLGYCSPDYIRTGRLTNKTNVYAFGVVLLEMLTGRSVIDKTKTPLSVDYNLLNFALPCLSQYNKLQSILDRRIEGQYSREDILPVAVLALKCLSKDPKDRPPMNEVVEALEAAGS